MASNPFKNEDIEDLKFRGTSADTELPKFPQDKTPTTDNNQKQMWQIFTDENGEVHRKSTPVTILENPFNALSSQRNNPFKNGETVKSAEHTNNTQTLPSSFANPNAYVMCYNGVDNGEPPQKPQRSSAEVNGGPGTYKLKTTEDIAVFEKDTTYTRFDNVDDQEDEVELMTGDSVSRPPNKKFLIRSESDLDLVLPSAGKPGLWIRIQWCLSGYGQRPKRVTLLKAILVAVGMCLAYALIVLIVYKSLD